MDNYVAKSDPRCYPFNSTPSGAPVSCKVDNLLYDLQICFDCYTSWKEKKNNHSNLNRMKCLYSHPEGYG